MRLSAFVAALWRVSRSATPGDGRELEHRVHELVVSRRLRCDHVPGGCSLMGIGSASGLLHQIDFVVHLSDTLVVGELKAYQGVLPKNDLLRFVGATDDLYVGRVRRAPSLPIIRIMAGTFAVSDAERTYAAIHGVLMVDPATVPSSVLAAPSLPLPPDLEPLSETERAAIASLVRPMQSEFALPRSFRPADASIYQFGIRTQRQWSTRLLTSQGAVSTVAEVAA